MSGPQRILVLARTVSILGNFAAPVALSFADASGFEPQPGKCTLLPGDGALSGVLFGVDGASSTRRDPFLPGGLPTLLPPGTYRFGNAPPDSRLGEQ